MGQHGSLKATGLGLSCTLVLEGGWDPHPGIIPESRPSHPWWK